MSTRIEGNVRVAGVLSCSAFSPPDGCIDDDAVEADAGIAADKLEHRHAAKWSQPNTTATAETRTLHVVYGATGEVVSFRAGSIAKCTGDSTVTVDLKKNGSSILTAAVTLDSGNTNRVAEAATIATAGLAAGDWLEVAIAVSAGSGTLATGVFAEVVLNEDAN